MTLLNFLRIIPYSLSTRWGSYELNRTNLNLHKKVRYYITVAIIMVATVFVGSGLALSQAHAQILPQSETLLATSFFNLDTAGRIAGLETTESLGTRAGKVANVILKMLGILFVILMIFGGIIWMTAAGNEERISQAKQLIIAASVGFIITFMSYSIMFIVNSYL